MRKLTKATWSAIIMVPGGAAVLFWFGWALHTSLFGETATAQSRSPWWVISLLLVGIWLLAVIPLNCSSLRDRQRRWLFTKDQEARAKVADTARHQQEAEQRIRAAMTQLRELERQHGDAGVVAFMLNLPVGDVLRVTGPQEQEKP